MEYAMYLRKSRSDIELQALGEGETLAKHRAILERLAEKHNIPMSSVTVYQQIVSGDTISERPQMQKLLMDIYKRKFAAVLVVEIERLARGSTSDQGQVADAFTATGTKIITPLKVYDPLNQYDQQYFEFGLFMARREFQTIKRRMMAGRQEALRSGSYIAGACCYGYEITKQGKRHTLKVVQDKAEVVRMIFDWFTEEHLTISQISRNLTSMHIPNPSGNEGWSGNTIKSLLINVHYTGSVRFGFNKSVNVYDEVSQKVVKRHQIQPLGKQTVIQNAHEAIISMEQFQKAQSIIGSHPKCKEANVLKNPFAGLVRCPLCGSLYQLKTVNGKPYLNHIHNVCAEKHQIAMDLFSSSVIESLMGYLQDFEFAVTEDGAKKKKNTIKKELSILNDKLTKAKQMRSRLFDAFESGVYSNDEFIERKANSAKVISDLEEQISKLQTQDDSADDYKGKISSIHTVLKSIADQDDAKQKNIIMKRFINRIELKIIKGKGGKFDLTPYIDIFLK